jgi:retron-type reverse transcriptase
MGQPNLFYKEGDLLEEVVSTEQLLRAFKRVRLNRGAAGIDGIEISEFEKNLAQELAKLTQEVRQWSYRPQPVRRVEIPKLGTSETRKIGVPCVRDRVIQASLQESLEVSVF